MHIKKADFAVKLDCKKQEIKERRGMEGNKLANRQALSTLAL